MVVPFPEQIELTSEALSPIGGGHSSARKENGVRTPMTNLVSQLESVQSASVLAAIEDYKHEPGQAGDIIRQARTEYLQKKLEMRKARVNAIGAVLLDFLPSLRQSIDDPEALAYLDELEAEALECRGPDFSVHYAKLQEAMRALCVRLEPELEDRLEAVLA